LGELYDALAPWVFGLASRILRDDGEAEEVLSDVFVQVWARVNQHEPSRGPLVPWVLSIARNRALDALRRRRRWWRKADRWGTARRAEDDGVVPGPDPAEAAVPVGRCIRRCTPPWPRSRRINAASCCSRTSRA